MSEANERQRAKRAYRILHTNTLFHQTVVPAMKPKDKSINSFGTFLDTIKGPQAKGSPVQARTQATSPLLDALAGDTPRTVADLMRETGMGVLELGKTLKAAQDAGLVELQTSAAGEEVQLTDLGRQLVGVTRNR